jgi:hypothetical protein
MLDGAELIMSPANLDRLRSIKTLPQLVAYLRDVLDWPIESDDEDEITFSYSAGELGLNEEYSGLIKEIRQLRPLASGQPWGIFFINFEKKRLPVTAMRRILRALALRKRASANKAERQAWQTEDLLFISAYGEDSDRTLTFAHFVDRPDLNLAELRVLGWDDDDTPLKLDYVVRTLAEKLRWSDDFADDPKLWRKQWSEAFRIRHGHVIRTSEELAGALAILARRLRGRIRGILRMEAGDGQIRTLQRAFRIGLIHDLDDDGFADMFAQTVTYGLFSVAARRTFPGIGTAVTKENVSDLVFTSPFLKDMLGVFLGIRSYKGKIDFDELGVSDVTDLLTSDDTDMEAVLRDFNNRTRGEDPVIHFYEHFLGAYNKQLKIQRGVFYTPQPVVSYIVRSVHELLQTEFGLADGLADTTTWGEMLTRHPGLKLPPLTDEPGEKRAISPDEPFVQILDPATGTATFLVEVIDVIHRTLAAKWKQQRLTDAQQRAAWNDYVPKHLLPRLHAFELMMAPYAIAHMKVGLKLAETGYRFGTEERARIYLTNALEPWVKQLPLIGFDALAHEAAAVNEIKRHKRFTVVIGNPPYSNFGMLNKSPFILGLLEDYKRGLNEKKINLDDDFIKFVRFSQRLLDVNGVGVFGMITNNVFIDGITHRRMRESLKASFTDIRILDLHGSAKKLEETPDGKRDENVFDIQQGVGISLFLNAGKGVGRKVSHTELWGERTSKYDLLARSVASSSKWRTVESAPPQHFFVPKNFDLAGEYQAAPALTEVFPDQNAGIQTKNDGFVYAMTRAAIEERIADLRAERADRIAQKYDLSLDGHWDIHAAKEDIRKNKGVLVQVLNKPFDKRWTYYTAKTSGFMARPRAPVMRCGLIPNRILLTVRNPRRGNTDSFFVADTIVDKDGVSPFDNATVFPLYLPNADDGQAVLLEENKLNLGHKFLTELRAKLNLRNGAHGLPAGLTPEDIFHYAYAVFHSPGYRSRYSEFLKIDFPRLPLTGNMELFRVLALLGGELTALHLLESPKLDKPITEFIGARNPEVEKISWSKNTVWVDKAQTTGFRSVHEEVWNFHIGGYQVCEKWLKDRKGRTLTQDDLAHYHKIVVALSETIRLMAEIDQVITKHGGWPGAFAAAPANPAAATPPAPKAPPPDLGLRTEDELPLG